MAIASSISLTQFGRDVESIRYDIQLYPFRAFFEDILGTKDIEHLHKFKGINPGNADECANELRLFCQSKSSRLQDLVSELLSTRIKMRFGPLVQCQSIPTIRFHFALESPEFQAEAEAVTNLLPHAFLERFYFSGSRPPMFHRDYDYGLPFGPMNLWIPVTDVCGANSLWIGSSQLNGRDALPIAINYGDALIFDGVRLWHGVVSNTSGMTRVSFDVRFQPRYEPWLGGL